MPLLTLKIDAPPNRIWAPALASALVESLYLLDSIGRVVTNRPTRSKAPLAWYVTGLDAQQALAQLAAEPEGEDLSPDVVGEVGTSYVDALRQVETGEVLPRFLSDTSLDHLRTLSGKLGKYRVGSLEAAWGNGAVTEARITGNARGKLVELRRAHVTSIGSVTGMLDSIASRNNNHRFQVYDEVWRRPVTVGFHEDELDTVKGAFGHRVRASGIVHRNSKGQPVRLDKSTLVELPDGPPLTKLVGFAPGAVRTKADAVG